jgi:hypothetical protein
MAEPLLTVDVDDAQLLAMLEEFGPALEMRIKVESKETADRVHREALARIKRRTGETAAHLVVEESHDGKGYVVWVRPDVRLSFHTSGSGRTHTQKVSYNAVGSWLEFGTRHMVARPFLFVSAQLEQAPHRRRVAEAVQDEINQRGLGD